MCRSGNIERKDAVKPKESHNESSLNHNIDKEVVKLRKKMLKFLRWKSYMR
jgi:hypothetical protein